MNPDPTHARIALLGLSVNAITAEMLVSEIDEAIRASQSLSVSYVNAHALRMAQKDAAFRGALNEMDIVFCDGFGPRLAAQLLGTPLPERFTGPDWITRILHHGTGRANRLFLLGAQPGVAAHAAANLQRDHQAEIVGTHHGYFDVNSAENDAVLATINEAAPDILLVGMGMPRQELWVQQHRQQLAAPVIICVGALFDYLTDNVPRGPRWLTDNGFEWLTRLWYEPRRLGERYLVGLPIFFGLVMRERWRRKGG